MSPPAIIIIVRCWIPIVDACWSWLRADRQMPVKARWSIMAGVICLFAGGAVHRNGVRALWRAKALLHVPAVGLLSDIARSLAEPEFMGRPPSDLQPKTSHPKKNIHPDPNQPTRSTNHETYTHRWPREDGAMAVGVPGAGGPALSAPPRAGLRAPGRVLPGRAGALRGPPPRRARLPRPLGVPPAARRPLRRLPVRLISFSFSRWLVGQLFFKPFPSPNTFTASSSRGCPSPCSSTPSAPPCTGSGSSATRAPCSGVVSFCTCRGR